MKKILLLTAGIFFSGLAVSQSSFQVTELVGGGAPQYSYSFSTDTNDTNSPTFGEEFKITNISSGSKLIKIRKVILSLATNTVTALNHDVYFCYNTTCYTPFTFYSTANIAAGASLPNGSGTSYGLRADMDHNKVIGTSVVRYTIYDSLNTSDSVNITLVYNITSGVGISNHTNVAANVHLMPNPASDLLKINYETGNSPAQLKIYDCLGKAVKTINLNPAEKTATTDVSALEQGVYFYTVMLQGKALVTRRLVITR